MISRIALVLLPGLLSACARPIDERIISAHGFIGSEVTTRRAIPDLVLTDTRGQPYPLAERAAGKMLLLFFGYTHCPDRCPVHLANLGAVLKRLPDEVTRDVLVVFVTTDPARDSLPRLAEWVAGFHPAFVALSGSDSVLKAAQRAAGIAEQFLAIRLEGSDSSRYVVGHATQLIAYPPDGLSLVEYPFGTRQSDWAHDIPLLVAFKEH